MNAIDSGPVMTRSKRARLVKDEQRIPGDCSSLFNPIAHCTPRDILIEREEAIEVKIEVKEEPDQEGGSQLPEVTQDNEPAQIEVKVEDDDMEEMITVKEEIDIPMDFFVENEDQEEEMEQTTDEKENSEDDLNESQTKILDLFPEVS